MRKPRNAVYLCVVTCSLAIAAWQPGLSWQRREAGEANSMLRKVSGQIDQGAEEQPAILTLRI